MLVQPNLSSTVEKHQLKQKSAHENSKPLVSFAKGQTVLIHNQRGMPKWITRRILQQKGPVSYLVKVGSRIRYCHVDHLLKSNAIADRDGAVAHIKNRDIEATDIFIPTEDDIDVMAEPTVVPRLSTRVRRPLRRLTEEMHS